MPSKLSSETARQRELYKYWQPHTSIFPQAEYDSTFNQNYQPRASYDAALTAYAQLGALRLNMKRGMVSVVDQHFQYVIAESTRSLSLQYGTALDPDDQLWFGLRTIPRAMGICAAALGDFTILEAADEASQNENEHNHHYVINDLSKDPRFETQPFVCGAPYLRFYAGVPIRSPAGYLIGIYSVVDDKPRHDFSNADIDILKDLAATVMDHFVLNTVRGQHTRSARMVKGLGLFVEGKSTLRDWFLRSGHLGNGPSAQDGSRGEWTLLDQANDEFGVETATRDLPKSLEALNLSPNSTPEIKYTHGVPENSDSIDDDISTESINTSLPSNAHAPAPSSSLPISKCDNASCLPKSPASVENLTASPNIPNGDEASSCATSVRGKHRLASDPSGLQRPSLLQDTQSLFQRASHLIRESLSVEGCAFLDASVTSDKQMVKASDGTPFKNGSDAHGPKPRDSICDVLGLSVRYNTGLEDTDERSFSFPPELLQRFLRRYPQGKIFYFENDGTFSSSEDDEDDTRANGQRTALNNALRNGLKKSGRYKRQASEEKDMSQLLAILPGIRCMAFFPLWNAETTRWSAAGFAWTKDPIRILDADEDLAYLSAFCNNIMAEKARIDATMADKMKGNFISSVSHEFRSPLHGILASAEHLQGMSLGAAQDELIGMINSCSKMLMDTIESVLDFTKINNAKKPKKTPKRGALLSSLKSSSAFDFAVETSEVDLGALTEEVVESILSGYNFGKAQSGGSIAYNRHLSSEKEGEKDATDVKQTSRVMTFVSIDRRASWVFRSQAGAWRRILMNLFGNALKYTESGQICVSLRCQDSELGQEGNVSTVTLSVSDSGRGISNDFLKHHLFTPFTQEDSLTPGTGLGLSIVRQLVDDLNGQIELKSEKGVGTEVTVQVTFLNHLANNTIPSTSDSPIETDTKPMQGLAVCLVGFDVLPNVEERNPGTPTTRAVQARSLNSVLRKFFNEWCGMKISNSKTLDGTVADVHVLLDAEFSTLLSISTAGGTSIPAENSQLSKLLDGKTVLVLCPRSKTQEQSILENNYPIAFVQQPLGPYKLAKALETVFKKKATHTLVNSQLELPLPPQLPTTAPVLSPILHSVAAKDSEQLSPILRIDLQQSTLDKTIAITKTISIDRKRPTVLLVDDNEINLKLLIIYMRKIGFPFETASNGLEALHRFQKKSADIKIILMDISMPVMDGLTSTREIRKYERENGLRPTTIIAVTGAASAQARADASSSGVDQFLTKPVPLKVLKVLIEECEAKIEMEELEMVHGAS